MTFTEIETRLGEILAALHDKGHARARAHLSIHLTSWVSICVGGLNDRDMPSSFFDDEPGAVLDKAAAFVAKLPAPEAAAMAAYRGKLGAALNFATDASLSDTITAGTRQSMDAVSAMLIEKE
ncbi:MAG: hypothetical protein GY767_17860 [Shimia sp.]|nr:hypothetical protein [Shimia sp.]